MKSSYKSLALAILLLVVSETLTEIKEESINGLCPLSYDKCQKFHDDLKQHVDRITLAHRRKVFDVISSDKFIRKYPVMKKILKLPVSDLKKSIIFLSGIGCTTIQISHILQSEKHSVSTMRSSCRRHIASIFKH